MSDLRAALFDIDGTLVESNDAHARAWCDAFAQSGIDMPFERVRPLIGMGGDQLLPALDPSLHPDTEPGKTVSERRKPIFRERYLPHLTPTPGARELVELLRERGLRCIVASSATEDELDALLDAGGVRGLFEDAATSADAEKSKPHPDIVGAALDRAKVAANEAVLVGDTRFDIGAASGAGVPAIALRCGGSSDDDLRGAVAIFDTPAALAAALAHESLEAITRRASETPR